tara:strand:- start:2230 stop:2520 length:291 start_codon:yes stop_codon:yes gene_type:complete
MPNKKSDKKKMLQKSLRIVKMGPPKPPNTKMGKYPSRSTYKGDGGLMRMTGGILPWQYSSDSRDMDHKRAGDPVSAAKQTKQEKYRQRLRDFEETD